MAFFPCVRFENQIMLWFRGQSWSQRTWTLEKKMKHCMTLLDEVKYNYDLVNMLFIVCMRKGLKLIMENPYSEEHFLRRYWCFLPSVIDRDRRENGDFFKKPTQYWFLNIEPQNNALSDKASNNAIDCKDPIRLMNKDDYEKTGAKTKKTARSMIHPQYANRFIRKYIIESDGCEFIEDEYGQMTLFDYLRGEEDEQSRGTEDISNSSC